MPTKSFLCTHKEQDGEADAAGMALKGALFRLLQDSP